MFRRTQDPLWRERTFDYRAFTCSGGPFQVASSNSLFVTPYRVSYNPKRQASWFGLFPFRSPLPGNRFFFLFLQVLRCFSSWVCLQDAMYSRQDTTRLNVVGSPFGNLRIKAHLQLPKHIGVSAVLHRLLVPRHSPCALNNNLQLSIHIAFRRRQLHSFSQSRTEVRSFLLSIAS